MLASVARLISLQGRRAVVTGGASGIGAAICRRLVEAGASTVIGDLNQEAAEALEAELNRLWPGSAFGRALDVSEPRSIRDLGQWCAERFGGCDIWVNNAGIYPRHPIEQIDDLTWDRVEAINSRGAFIGCREAAALMRSHGKGGVILNVSSITGLRGLSHLSHYSASKHSVIGLTRSLSIELGSDGIRVLAIAPAQVMTDGVAARSTGEFLAVHADPTTSAAAAELPLRRIAVPDDVARVALFCVSDLAALMTGSVIPVDAGLLAS